MSEERFDVELKIPYDGPEKRVSRATDLRDVSADRYFGLERRVKSMETRQSATDIRMSHIERAQEYAESSENNLRQLIEGSLNNVLNRIKVLANWADEHDTKQRESNILRSCVILSNIVLAITVAILVLTIW